MGSARLWGRRAIVTAILALGVVTSGGAVAHPHGWVDLGVRVIMDDEGRVEALHQRWRMDPFYSLVILEELEAAEGNESMEVRLDRLGGEILANLAPHDYYTEFTHAGRKVPVDEVREYTVMQRNGRVEFSFLLPLETPVAPDEHPMRYQVFDPTYYIEILHEAGDDEMPRENALVLSGAEAACTTRIEPADPDPHQVAQAAMLDVDDEAEPGLGRYFAETGVVECKT